MSWLSHAHNIYLKQKKGFGKVLYKLSLPTVLGVATLWEEINSRTFQNLFKDFQVTVP